MNLSPSCHARLFQSPIRHQTTTNPNPTQPTGPPSAKPTPYGFGPVSAAQCGTRSAKPQRETLSVSAPSALASGNHLRSQSSRATTDLENSQNSWSKTELYSKPKTRSKNQSSPCNPQPQQPLNQHAVRPNPLSLHAAPNHRICLAKPSTNTPSVPAPLPRFPHHTSHLLLAAYLASHTPPRADTLLYSKSSQHASRRRRRQHRQTLPAATAASSRRRKIPRHLLGPQPFPLERLFAIFHATSPSTPVAGGEIMAQVATLAGLSLLLRASSAAADDGGGGGGKWKVGFGWEFAVAVARGVEFDLEIYLGE